MAAAGREQERDLARFVYVTRFGSHRCGGILQLGGRRAQGRGSTGRGADCSPEEPRAAAPAGAELTPGPRSRAPAASPPARASSARSCPRPAARAAFRPSCGGASPAETPSGLRPGGAPRAVGGRARPPVSPAACAGPKYEARGSLASRESRIARRKKGTCRSCLTQKNLAKKFDFPIPLNEVSKIMKKKKKISVWNRVYKVISRMLEENEKYRFRLKCQQLSCESVG
ncbi:uncharacterized protein C5orf47 homolog [Eumetopias jubatus]|uniref:uncharacterized protein C5orf47 homolog n=1 Tax=Eumetopias jubatus TaxID=34886 RepID=UPI001016BADE|nr:uncharacterized protein C5orf47 homolog [Eumetopias jubatus]